MKMNFNSDQHLVSIGSKYPLCLCGSLYFSRSQYIELKVYLFLKTTVDWQSKQFEHEQIWISITGGTTPAPPPPLRGRRDRMRVPKISGKGVLFVRQSPARELLKKGGIWLFTRRSSFKKGVVFLSLSLWTPEKVIKWNIGGTLSSVLDLGGSPRQEKPAKSPRRAPGSEILSVRR